MKNKKKNIGFYRDGPGLPCEDSSVLNIVFPTNLDNQRKNCLHEASSMSHGGDNMAQRQRRLWVRGIGNCNGLRDDIYWALG
jgi:hypothetical protein